jgi:hypothetical protein
MTILGTTYTHKRVKSKNCAAFPLVLAYVFDVKVIVCIFVIAMHWIAFVF